MQQPGLIEELNMQSRKIERLTAENKRLRAAIKPFIASAELDDTRFNDSHPVMLALNSTWEYSEEHCHLTLGDFRRVRDAYQQQPPSCDKAPNKHHYLMPSGQCSCQDQSWAK